MTREVKFDAEKFAVEVEQQIRNERPGAKGKGKAVGDDNMVTKGDP